MIELKKQLDSMIEETGIAGLSCVVIEDNCKTAYFLGTMGSVSSYKSRTLNEECIYDIASLTKVIGTTTRVLQLIQKNMLSFDTRVCDVIKEYSGIGISVKNLLLHTGGLEADLKNKSSVDDSFIEKYFRSLNVKNNIKHPMVYSDIGFILLGKIIEEIDQTNLGSSFKANIFEKIGMNDTSYYPLNMANVVPTEYTLDRGLICGTVHDSKAYRISYPIGSAGLFSTLFDISKFVEAIMYNRMKNNEKLFAEDIYNKLFNTHCNRTIGWEKKYGDNIINHTGFTGVSIGSDLEYKRSLILLTNRVHPHRNQKFLQVRDNLYKNFFRENFK